MSDPLLARGQTVSYYNVAKSSNAIEKVYNLHIGTLTKELLGIAIFMILLSVILLICCIWHISEWNTSEMSTLVLSFIGLVVTLVGVFIGLLGTKVARLQSRRSSKSFTKTFKIYMIAFVSYVGITLVNHAVLRTIEVNGLLNYSVYILSFLLVGFAGYYSVFKSVQFNVILTKAIFELTTDPQHDK